MTVTLKQNDSRCFGRVLICGTQKERAQQMCSKVKIMLVFSFLVITAFFIMSLMHRQDS